MRTLYTLFALISLILVALVVTAAPSPPTLSIDCTSPCVTGNYTLTADGANPHKAYSVVAVDNDDASQNFNDLIDGSISLPVTLFPGSWTFTLYLLDHTEDVANPVTQLGLPLDVTITP
jgi:hypothetical protein